MRTRDDHPFEARARMTREERARERWIAGEMYDRLRRRNRDIVAFTSDLEEPRWNPPTAYESLDDDLMRVRLGIDYDTRLVKRRIEVAFLRADERLKGLAEQLRGDDAHG